MADRVAGHGEGELCTVCGFRFLMFKRIDGAVVCVGCAKQADPPSVPVFRESIAGALIDSARISVMASLAMLPPREVPLIILPGSAAEEADDAAATVHGCLEQAMEWLDAARVHTVAAGAPVTSLHVAGPAGGEHG